MIDNAYRRIMRELGISSLSSTARIERLLLTLGGIFLSLNIVSLAISRGFRLGDWITIFIWILCSIMGMLVLEQRLPNRDPFMFPITMFLTGWGLVVIDRFIRRIHLQFC